MTYITRVCYNSSNWQRPTGDAEEAANTFRAINGYGHEEWLFRFEWQIGGWQYGFIQGVNKGWEARLERGERIADVVIFTIDELRRRRYVARIRDLEFLDEAQGTAVLNHYKKVGWYDLMLNEIDAVGGRREGLGNADWAPYILNVRFRPEEVEWYPVDTFAAENDPVQFYNRYQLIDIGESVALPEPAPSKRLRGRKGMDTPPSQTPYVRNGSASRECSPEHAMIQQALFEELKAEYPAGRIIFEENFVDVTVLTKQEKLLFEIKSDFSTRKVLRQAIGQLLEYAYYSGEQSDLDLRLIAVGRTSLSAEDGRYLEYLRNTLGLPLEYRQVQMPSERRDKRKRRQGVVTS